jgi:crossover junction endodeoxyribonuclease RusA
MSSFEFILDGPPISQQARQREGLHAWKDLVRAEAERLWPRGVLPSKASLRLTITYYYEGSPVDTNGIVKPITDALIGLVLNDNSQIEELAQSKQDLFGSFRIPDFSPILAEGFGRGREFLHIKIDGLDTLGERIPNAGPLQEALQESGAQVGPLHTERIQPQSEKSQSLAPESTRTSPEEQIYSEAYPPSQGTEAGDESPENQPESSQTQADETTTQPGVPGEMMPAPPDETFPSSVPPTSPEDDVPIGNQES